MKEICSRCLNVLHPHQHVEMESAAFLELETIEKGLQVLGSGITKVGEHICPPSITIASRQVTPWRFVPERALYEWFQLWGCPSRP